MFQGLKNGWDLLYASMRAFKQNPIFLVPLLCVWLIYAPTVIYFKWHFNWDNYTTKESFFILYLVIFAFALLLTLSCSILLELIQQKETGKEFSLGKSLNETLTKNIVQILVLSFFWSIVWFLLTVLEIIFSKKKNSDTTDEENAENVAYALTGGDYSFWSLSFDALKKGVRMIVFLIMPAFAWEDLGINMSLKRGMSILKIRVNEFISGYTLSYLAAIIVFIPPSIMFYLSGKLKVEFPDWSWIVCIIYIALAWSYTIYLEQMYTAELYLWHLKWEKEAKLASEKNEPIPEFNEIERPSIVDKKPDLIF